MAGGGRGPPGRADLLGTAEHLEMRQTESRAVMDSLKSWLDAEQPRHPPRSPMGEAIGYTLGQWGALTLFLTGQPPPHRQQRLRTRATSRRPSGARTSSSWARITPGENLAGLYSLIATCEVNGVNPIAYLADVLMRVQTHPASRIDELLPRTWKPPPLEPSA